MPGVAGDSAGAVLCLTSDGQYLAIARSTNGSSTVSDVLFQVVSVVTGQVVHQSLVTDAACPAVVRSSTGLVLITINSAATTINRYLWTQSTKSLGSASALSSGLSLLHIAACNGSDGSILLVHTTSTTSVVCRRFSNIMALLATDTHTAASAATAPAIAAGSGLLAMVAFVRAGTVHYQRWSFAAASFPGGSTLASTVACTWSAVSCFGDVAFVAAGTANEFAECDRVVLSTGTATQRDANQHKLASGPVALSESAVVLPLTNVDASGALGSSLVLAVSDPGVRHTPEAELSAVVYSGPGTFTSNNPGGTVHALGTTGVSANHLYLARYETRDGGRNVLKVAAIRLASSTSAVWSTVEAAGSLVVAGGVMTFHDGAYLQEVSTVGRPTLSASTSNSTGSLPSTPYWYTGHFSTVDAAGRVNLGPPGRIQLVSPAPGDDTAAVTLRGYIGRARRQSTSSGLVDQGILCDVFRTIASSTPSAAYESHSGAGSVLFRAVNSSLAQLLAANTLGRQATPTLLNSDSAIQGLGGVAAAQAAGVLYSQGTLERGAPPPTSLVCEAGDRLWCAGMPNRRMLLTSLPFAAGEPVSFCGPGAAQFAAFILELPDAIEALWSHQDRPYCATAGAIYSLEAIGPDAAGNGAIAPARRVPGGGRVVGQPIGTPVGSVAVVDGCVSIVTPDGVQRVGDAVQAELTAAGGPAPHGLCFDAANREVLVTAESGAVFALDIDSGAWYSQAGNVAGGVTTLRQVVYSRTLGRAAVGANAELYQPLLLSASGSQTATLETHRFSADLLGWTEVHGVRLALRHVDGDCSVECRASLDGGAFTSLGTRTLGAAADGVVVLRWSLPVRQAQTLAVRWLVTAEAADSGVELLGGEVEIEADGRPGRTSAASNG